MEAYIPAWPAPGSPSQDLSILECALRERSGGANVAALSDVFHLAQRRHGYRGGVDEAAHLLQASGRWRVTQSTCLAHRMVEPADRPPTIDDGQSAIGQLHHG